MHRKTSGKTHTLQCIFHEPLQTHSPAFSTCSVPWVANPNELHQWVTFSSSQWQAPAGDQRNGEEWDESLYFSRFPPWGLQTLATTLNQKSQLLFKLHTLFFQVLVLWAQRWERLPAAASPAVLLRFVGSPSIMLCIVSLLKPPQIILLRMCHLFPPKTKPKWITVVNWGGKWEKGRKNTHIWGIVTYSGSSLFIDYVLCGCFLLRNFQAWTKNGQNTRKRFSFNNHWFITNLISTMTIATPRPILF